MSELHVIVGAGPVGRETAQVLASQGAEVVLASRSGAGSPISGVRRTAVAATDAEALAGLSWGAVALYNCLNPTRYDKWAAEWPPMASALLVAAERTGATLVTAGNLYPYGPVDGPMIEGMPDLAEGPKGSLRATMWQDALAAHRAGRIRAVEVRGSDYMGPGVGANAHIPRVVAGALAGKAVRVFGSPDQPHSWTDVRDMGRALACVATEERAWGRIWHAPTDAPRTQREAIDDVCRAAGKPPVAVRPFPRMMRTVGGWFSPILRELEETAYQFERPFIMDSSAITRELGLEPTPWAETCRRTAVIDAGDRLAAA